MDYWKEIIANLPFLVGAARQPEVNWTRIVEAIIIGAFSAGVVITKVSSDIEHLSTETRASIKRVEEKVDDVQTVVDQAHPRKYGP